MRAGRTPFRFEIRERDGRARRGQVVTLHGAAETPAFMAVGTAATVKALTPEQVRRTGTEIVLCNTYHLALRPGADVISSLGGLHEFMRWDGPILTDSGGFQVFSLGDTTRADDDGVTFKSHIDGAEIRLTPERSMEIQLALNSDVAMVFDECLPYPCDEDRVRRSLFERTLPWELRSLACHPRDGRAVFGIGQGGVFPELRKACLLELTSHPFDGFAIGGLAVGEAHDAFLEIVDLSTAMLPEDRPRYLMGVGTPREIIEAISRGVDLFDCVLPTRNARNGQALTMDGPLRLRNAAFTRDPRPLEPDCPCETCSGGFSRAYLRHLFMANEMLAATLTSAHNLSMLQRLFAQARAAISQGTFNQYAAGVLARYPASAGLGLARRSNAAGRRPARRRSADVAGSEPVPSAKGVGVSRSDRSARRGIGRRPGLVEHDTALPRSGGPADRGAGRLRSEGASLEAELDERGARPTSMRSPIKLAFERWAARQSAKAASRAAPWSAALPRG